MSDKLHLDAEPRDNAGTKFARRLRRDGKIPAVMYGRDFDPTMLTLDGHSFEKFIHDGGRGLIDLKYGAAHESAVIKDLQWDTFGIHILHVDFERVTASQRIEVEVPIELDGIAPGIADGGVLNHHIFSLSIECAASAIPEMIEVDITGLRIGDAIHVSDLKLPAGAVVLVDAEEVVVQVNEAEVVELETDEGPDAPEVIDENADEAEGDADGEADGPQGDGDEG